MIVVLSSIDPQEQGKTLATHEGETLSTVYEMKCSA